jgi:hypothetical protein
MPALVILTDLLVALVWVTLTDELLTAFVLGLDDRVLVVLAALWLGTLDVSALLWNTDVLVTAVVDLVGHELLVESALWHLWAESVKALYVAGFAARTDSAHIAFVVPRLLENSWAIVLVNASWWLWSWGGSSNGGGSDALEAWAAFASLFLDETVWTVDLLVFDLWTNNGWIVADALVSVTLAWVLGEGNVEFLVGTALWLVGASWWTGLTVTDTVHDLVAALGSINVIPLGDVVRWTAVWEALSWALDWRAFALALFVTDARFAHLAWVWPALTDINVTAGWSKTTSFWVMGGGDSSGSSGSELFATVGVSTASWTGNWVASSESSFAGLAGLHETLGANVGKALLFVASASLTVAAEVSAGKGWHVLLVWLTGWVW